MPVVGLRQLSRETRDVVEQLEKDGEPVVITRQGRPIASLTPISKEEAGSLALALAPEFVASRERAAKAIAAGEGEPASQVLAEFEAEANEEDRITEVEVPAFPTSLLERAAEVAALGTVGSTAFAAPIQSLNLELINTLLQEAWVSVTDRVRTVNENIVAHAGGDAERLSTDTYLRELKRVTEAERLSSRYVAYTYTAAVSKK